MVILPSAYLPSIEYMTYLYRGGCVVDLGEHFIKRSERNRAAILTASGPMALTVHLVHADRPRTPIRDLRIDYSKRWMHQHWISIVSAYRSSPYFDHYADRFEPFYTRSYGFLVDYNTALLAMLCDTLRIAMPAFSDRYLEAGAADLDRRPKRKDAEFVSAPYVQVFADRQPFVPNLSIVDLLFCEGPRSLAFLERSRS